MQGKQARLRRWAKGKCPRQGSAVRCLGWRTVMMLSARRGPREHELREWRMAMRAAMMNVSSPICTQGSTGSRSKRAGAEGVREGRNNGTSHRRSARQGEHGRKGRASRGGRSK